MSKTSSIHFHLNKDIDKQRWDACVDASPHGLIYAGSFYLDNIAPGWHGLTDENYTWVLPITARKKWGINYLYQPPFTQQLGLISTGSKEVPFQSIIDLLQRRYAFWEVNWNYTTPAKILPPTIKVYQATNYILDLRTGYDTLYAGYHRDLLKNLKRGQHFNLQYRHSSNFKQGIDLFRQYYGSRISHVVEHDYHAFNSVCQYALQQEMLICREVLNNEGELLGIALLLKDNRRLYNLMNTTTENGRKKEANHFLFDAIIKEFSGQELLFDFEGSDLPGVKSFYENFGGVNQSFYQIRYNRLPWPLRLLKR